MTLNNENIQKNQNKTDVNFFKKSIYKINNYEYNKKEFNKAMSNICHIKVDNK
jgi:hypothetical protein